MFRRIPKALRDELLSVYLDARVKKSTPIKLKSENKNENIKYFIFSSGDRTHNLSRL